MTWKNRLHIKIVVEPFIPISYYFIVSSYYFIVSSYYFIVSSYYHIIITFISLLLLAFACQLAIIMISS
jgi:NADH:ubiquinone oxidoreductase subunit K